MNIKTNLKSLLAGVAALAGFAAVAEPSWAVVTTEAAHDGSAWTDTSGDTSRYTAYLCTVAAAETYFGGKTTYGEITDYLSESARHYTSGMQALQAGGTKLAAYGYDEGEYSFSAYFQPGSLVGDYIAVLAYAGGENESDMFRVFSGSVRNDRLLIDPAAGTGTASVWTEAVPEPSSGLLLLFGVAGLALRRRRMNAKMKMKSLSAGVAVLAAVSAFGDATVKIDKVESKEPWTTVQVDYTLDGISDSIDYKIVFDLTVKGVSHSVTNEAMKLANGPASKQIVMTDLFTPTKADPKAQVTARIIAVGPVTAVQLWAGGPYWATCNVGASSPEEAGYYFWWGDTVGYVRNAADNGWVSVKDGTAIEFSKTDPTAGITSSMTPDQLQSKGWIDASRNLTLAHDAAHAYLGGPWRLPTSEEARALINNCMTTWTTYNGVVGRLIRGKGAYASKSIFLPATGYGFGSTFSQFGLWGFYWVSTLDSNYSGKARHMYFYSGHFGESYEVFYEGLSVRPVRGANE